MCNRCWWHPRLGQHKRWAWSALPAGHGQNTCRKSWAEPWQMPFPGLWGVICGSPSNWPRHKAWPYKDRCSPFYAWRIERLVHFDVHQPVVLSADASQHGLGAVCLQNNKPVAFASRALTETESHYAQIEKELLALVYACHKFHDFIYGRPITVETDHQPLITSVGESYFYK